MINQKELLKNILLDVISVSQDVSKSTNVNLSASEICRMAITIYISSQKNGAVFLNEADTKKDELPVPDENNKTKEQPKAPSKGGNGFDHDTEAVVIPFGKFRGHALGEVIRKDRNYIVWLSTACKNKKVRDASVSLLNHTEPLDTADYAH